MLSIVTISLDSPLVFVYPQWIILITTLSCSCTYCIHVVHCLTTTCTLNVMCRYFDIVPFSKVEFYRLICADACSLCAGLLHRPVRHLFVYFHFVHSICFCIIIVYDVHVHTVLIFVLLLLFTFYMLLSCYCFVCWSYYYFVVAMLLFVLLFRRHVRKWVWRCWGWCTDWMKEILSGTLLYHQSE